MIPLPYPTGDFMAFRPKPNKMIGAWLILDALPVVAAMKDKSPSWSSYLFYTSAVMGHRDEWCDSDAAKNWPISAFLDAVPRR